jgi:hypothetical protein
MKLHERIMAEKRKRKRYRKGGAVPGRKGVSRADRKPRALHAQAGAGVQAVPGVTYDIPMRARQLPGGMGFEQIQPDLLPSGKIDPQGRFLGHLDLRGAGQGEPQGIYKLPTSPAAPQEIGPRTEGRGWSNRQAPVTPPLSNAPPLEETQGPPPPLPEEFQPPPPPPADTEASPPADMGPPPSKYGGRRKSGGRSPFSHAGHQPRTKEHVGRFGSWSPFWGHDHRTPEERRASGAGIIKRS